MSSQAFFILLEIKCILLRADYLIIQCCTVWVYLQYKGCSLYLAVQASSPMWQVLVFVTIPPHVDLPGVFRAPFLFR